MKELIMDMESGIAKSENTHTYLTRSGVQFAPRAPGQHARIVERRGALLRDTIHRIDAQLKWEGIDVPFKIRVGEAVFAGDALLTVNNTTPYNAVYGRAPHLLPNIHALEDESTTNKSMPGLIRDSHKLRENKCPGYDRVHVKSKTWKIS